MYIRIKSFQRFTCSHVLGILTICSCVCTFPIRCWTIQPNSCNVISWPNLLDTSQRFYLEIGHVEKIFYNFILRIVVVEELIPEIQVLTVVVIAQLPQEQLSFLLVITISKDTLDNLINWTVCINRKVAVVRISKSVNPVVQFGTFQCPKSCQYLGWKTRNWIFYLVDKIFKMLLLRNQLWDVQFCKSWKTTQRKPSAKPLICNGRRTSLSHVFCIWYLWSINKYICINIHRRESSQGAIISSISSAYA